MELSLNRESAITHLWNCLVSWIKEVFREAKEHLAELQARPLSRREYGIVMRLPAAIAASALTVVAIKASEMGIITAVLFVVVMAAVAVVLFSWAARGGENDYA